MILTPAQAQIATDRHRFRVVCCGRRFGKTTLAVEEIKAVAVYQEARIAYIAPTYQQARDIAWQILIRELKNISEKINESRLEIEVQNTKGTKSIIQLRGWENIETLRGQSFDFIVIDEIASMRNFYINWEEVIRPTLTDRKGQALFISTPKGYNHFYDLYNTTDPDYKSFHFTSYDNPHIPKEEIDKAKEEIPEDRFAQEYLADFRKTQGLVYPEFNRERHLTTAEPSTVAETLVGIDWGYSNPAGVVRVRVDGDRRYWVDSEYYQSGKTTEQIVEYAKTLQGTKAYPDPAEPDRNVIAERLGLNIMPVSKEITAGVDVVRALFKQNRIFINKECKNLILELETYHFPDKKPDNNETEKPVKENDHLCDSLRYVLFNYEQLGKNRNIIQNPIFEEYGTHYIA